jgi:hypothetical protein
VRHVQPRRAELRGYERKVDRGSSRTAGLLGAGFLARRLAALDGLSWVRSPESS